MRITKKKIAAVVAATTVVALGAGSAYAYFTSTASGTGTATVGQNTAWTIAVDGAVGGPLFPGDATTNETFAYSVTNNSGATQYLHLVTATIDSNSDGDVGATGCKSAWFTATPAGDPEGEYAPGAINHGTVTVTMIESHTDQSACAGVSPTFTVTAS